MTVSMAHVTLTADTAIVLLVGMATTVPSIAHKAHLVTGVGGNAVVKMAPHVNLTREDVSAPLDGLASGVNALVILASLGSVVDLSAIGVEILIAIIFTGSVRTTINALPSYGASGVNIHVFVKMEERVID